jgi:hypothetical protein
MDSYLDEVVRQKQMPQAAIPSAAHSEVAASVIAHLFERQVKQQTKNIKLLNAVPQSHSTYKTERNAYVGWIYQLSDRLKFGYDTGTSAVILADRTFLVLARADRSLSQEGKDFAA